MPTRFQNHPVPRPIRKRAPALLTDTSSRVHASIPARTCNCDPCRPSNPVRRQTSEIRRLVQGEPGTMAALIGDLLREQQCTPGAKRRYLRDLSLQRGTKLLLPPSSAARTRKPRIASAPTSLQGAIRIIPSPHPVSSPNPRPSALQRDR
jgi:hypothetical protein